jgi:aminoglycoside phosphotransferase (APT) family kinase protein
VTVSAEKRDLGVVRAGLQRWFTERDGDADSVRVGPLHKATSGFSSETLFVDVIHTTSGVEVEEHYVTRLPPAGGGIFPHYDLTRQAEVQRVLLANGIPAAEPLAVELDESWLGVPFLVMQKVGGDVLADSYMVTGRLHDDAPDAQSQVQSEFLDRLADVHRIDWVAAGLGELTPAHARGLVHDVARLEEYLRWATEGDVPEVHAAAIAWLQSHRPQPEPPLSLCWGDPRISNVLYGPDWSQQALLDWEMASIGAGEMDVAWFVALHELTSEALGTDLPGFLDRRGMLDHWAARLGRPLVAFRWFEVLALVRSDAIFLRIRAMLLASGKDQPWLRGPTPGQIRIESRIS